MKNYSWILLTGGLVVLALTPQACGGGGEGTGGSGGGSTTTTSTKSTTVASTTSTGTGPDCTGILNPGDCATCVEGSCCAELEACNNDANCLGCASGQIDPAMCEGDPASKAALDAFNACTMGTCKAACFPDSKCNPVTNEGCNTAAGQACDFAGGHFECYDPPNDVMQCGACKSSGGPYCAPGMHCDDTANKCNHFCCTDADCGTGKCDLTNKLSGVGLCTDAMGTGPSCDAPAMPPSMGSCYTPTP